MAYLVPDVSRFVVLPPRRGKHARRHKVQWGLQVEVEVRLDKLKPDTCKEGSGTLHDLD
jgi:hypothetical protein